MSDYPRFNDIEHRAITQGTAIFSLDDLVGAQTEHSRRWAAADRAGLPFDEPAPSFRNMGVADFEAFYAKLGRTVVVVKRGPEGHLGPRFLSALERLATQPKSGWTMVPVERDWSVVFSFVDPADAEPFRLLNRQTPA